MAGAKPSDATLSDTLGTYWDYYWLIPKPLLGLWFRLVATTSIYLRYFDSDLCFPKQFCRIQIVGSEAVIAMVRRPSIELNACCLCADI